MGFGAESRGAATRLAIELDIQVDSLDEPNPGLAGYVQSISGSPVKAAA